MSSWKDLAAGDPALLLYKPQSAWPSEYQREADAAAAVVEHYMPGSPLSSDDGSGDGRALAESLGSLVVPRPPVEPLWGDDGAGVGTAPLHTQPAA